MHICKKNLFTYKFVVFLLLIFPFIQIHAKIPVTFIIKNTPKYTPLEDTLYLITSFDNWNIKDANYPFKHFADGCYRLTIEIEDNASFEYKINRGNWDKIEGNKWGDYLENRYYSYSDSIYEVELDVASWQDMHDSEYPMIKIVVTSVPDNTPHDATIYVTGNFNNWRNNDPKYKLIKQDDGSYSCQIQTGIDSINYKFTRGNWESIEGRWDGGMKSNRVYNLQTTSNKSIITQIESWRDLSTGLIWLDSLFLSFIILCFLFICIIIRFPRTYLLVSLLSVLSLGLFAKFFYFSIDLFYSFPYMYLFPALIYSFIGSLIHTWFKSNIKKEKNHLSFIHLLPILPALWFLKYTNLSVHEFNLGMVNNRFVVFIYCTYSYSLILNLLFSYNAHQFIKKQIDYIPELSYRFHKATRTNWILSSLIFMVAIICIWLNIDIKLITDWLESVLWINLGIVMIYLGLYFMLSLNSDFTNNKSKSRKNLIDEDNWIHLKNKLNELMIEKEVYTKPNITLTDLASYLGTNNHYVSKLINEGFNMSYTDYINRYRINAFIKEMTNDKKNNPFIYHAYKVGFNSKSAFYRAFKKVTNKTPSDYFINKLN